MAPTWPTRYEISWVSARRTTNRRPTLGGGRCSPSAAGTVSATPSPTALPECRTPPPLKSIYTCDDSNFSKDCLYLEFAGPVLNVSSTVMINRLSQDKKKSILQLKKRSLPTLSEPHVLQLTPAFRYGRRRGLSGVRCDFAFIVRLTCLSSDAVIERHHS